MSEIGEVVERLSEKRLKYSREQYDNPELRTLPSAEEGVHWEWYEPGLVLQLIHEASQKAAMSFGIHRGAGEVAEYLDPAIVRLTNEMGIDWSVPEKEILNQGKKIGSMRDELVGMLSSEGGGMWNPSSYDVPDDVFKKSRAAGVTDLEVPEDFPIKDSQIAKLVNALVERIT